MTQSRSEAQIAVGNNADLCAAILGAHGIRFKRDLSILLSVDDPPDYYPKLVTLEPNSVAQQMMLIQEVVEAGQPVTAIKDSFATLDYAALNMAVLFEASWIWHDGGHEEKPDAWRRVSEATDLSIWHRAWCAAGSPTEQVIFPASSLDDPSLVFLARGSGATIEAGCIANLSDSVTGLSNVFTVHEDSDVFAQAKQAVSAISPGTPVVGYESGQGLATARSVGFREVGKLRVLAQQN
ncbi:hypothetical protein [Algihabitans albus]|uniref:hypothetical protein n=1 Tax=Algihabitans albus TaxID=2164067 RepID=UPI0013C35F8A|nr:hypothetical protein [Algihabitans albus]